MKNESNHPTLNDPEVVTYDKTELTVETAFVVLQSGMFSSRRLKSDFLLAAGRRVLRRLMI